MMLKCKKCGFKLESNVKFCPDCGTPVSGTKQSSRMQNVYKTQVRGKPQTYGVLNLENLEEGHIIDNRYEIKEKLGQGGFGAVYRVFDKDMNIDKALKVIPEAIINDKEAMFDLQNEAQTMIALNHPNIVRVFDFHKTGSIKFIDMEFIEGKTLTEIKLEYKNKQVPENIVQELAVQIASGMSYAHQNGILHKDIKPQNMMVTKDNKVKIMDFGIAETVRTSMSRIQNSTSSGTLVYMSPEQIKGKDVGKESDIYSFGVLLYELLNGNPPFYKGALEYQILNEKPEQLSAVSAKMNDLIMKCLEKDYKDRFKDFRKIIEFFGEKIKQYSPISVSKKQTTASASKLKTLTAISIITEPSDAIVYLNGKKFEELTPLNTKYVVGEITIKIEKAGYKTIEDIIEISEGSSNEFYLELESVMGTITIESETEEIPIYLNKKKTEFVTPHTFDNIIPNKEYEICLKLGSRHSEIKSIKIELNKHKKIYFHESEFKFKIPENMVVVKGGKLQRKYHRFFKTIEQIIKVNSYIIGKYLVTQQEYEEIMGNNPSSCKKEKVINKGFLGIDRKIEKITEPKHPVENVSWYDAVEFCNKKSLIEGLTPCYTINKNRKDSNNKSTIDNLKWTVTCNFNANGYRLPTDAEWEYTARGGIKSKGYKYSGSNSIEEVAWSTSNSKQKTHKVGSLQLNELGIYDMSGNVWEWCWNWFDTEYYKKKLQNNQTRPVYGKNRVRRGGSFFSDANNCDIGNFSYSSPHLKFNTVGFRICMTAYSKTEIN